MTVRVYMRHPIHGEEFHVDFDIDDKATVEDINREATGIADRNYVEKAEWEIVKRRADNGETIV